MKYRTETVRVGEYLGPIDWTYDFMYHFGNHCCSDERKQEYCKEAMERLKTIENGKDYQAWTGVIWQDVLQVGMYDGWPFWKPVPSVLLSGTLGPEWRDFSYVSRIRVDPKAASLAANVSNGKEGK